MLFLMTITPPVGLLEEVGGTGFQLVSGVWIQQAVLPKRLRANSKRIFAKFNFKNLKRHTVLLLFLCCVMLLSLILIVFVYMISD
jgi:hypothetical protein